MMIDVIIVILIFLAQIGEHDEVLPETPTVAPVYYKLPPHVQALYDKAKQGKLENHQTMMWIDAWGDKMLAWAEMSYCLGGPGGDLKRDCTVPANSWGDLDLKFDYDQDGDLDLEDVGMLLRATETILWRKGG